MSDPIRELRPQPAPDVGAAANVDDVEVARFAKLADRWWDPNGAFRPLHELAATRMSYLRSAIVRHFARADQGLTPLAGLTILDVGCGGGLVAEPYTRLGAIVTGIDPAAENIGAAKAHATTQGLAIDYRATTAEALARENVTFDVVSALEVIEHVPDQGAFVATLAGLVRPGGLVLLSTINRTLKSYTLAIVGAEYVLRWLPVGTHRWDRFVTPAELEGHCSAAGLTGFATRGMVFNPLNGRWVLSRDTDVNYFATAGRPRIGEA